MYLDTVYTDWYAHYNTTCDPCQSKSMWVLAGDVSASVRASSCISKYPAYLDTTLDACLDIDMGNSEKETGAGRKGSKEEPL